MARTGRDDWSVSAGTHSVTLARKSFLAVKSVTHRNREEAQAVFVLRIVRTPIGEETDAVGRSEKPMTAQFKRFADGWKIATLMQ